MGEDPEDSCAVSEEIFEALEEDLLDKTYYAATVNSVTQGPKLQKQNQRRSTPAFTCKCKRISSTTDT